MAVLRFIGAHIKQPGPPGSFRTAAGTIIPHGTPRVSIESLFSRKGETANLDAVKTQHNEAVQQFQADRDISVHITNNVPHIGRLNEGWSQQTNAGFFERALYAAAKSVIGTWKLKEL